MLDKAARIYIAGHRGIVGSAMLRRFRRDGFLNLVLRSRSELDLTRSEDVFGFFQDSAPDYVLIAAAKVGGIAANMAAPVEFLLENLKIQNNLLEACQRQRVRKTVFLGSSCIYPRLASQPMPESSFMQGPLEPTNESYAVAKIAGIRLAQALHEQYGLNVLCPMPCNIYGPGDHFEFERAHVVSSLVRRFYEAVRDHTASLTLWGTGQARREFLHVDDLVDACMFLLNNVDSAEIINVGTGHDVSIAELAHVIAELVGYRGAIEWDTSRPDGMPRKVLNVAKLHDLGWRHSIDLSTGLRGVIEDYRVRFAPPVRVATH